LSKALIGITGTKGSGKSTLAAMLRDEIPNAEIVALADALKDDVADLVAGIQYIVPPIGREWLEAHKGTVYGPLLQGFGSLFREAVSPDYWVEQVAAYWLDVVDNNIGGVDALIVPDVRYENEARWITSQGGLLIAVQGPSRWEGDERDTAHPSETGVDTVRQLADIVVFNDDGLDALRTEALSIAARVAARP
jgi:energy-coupling factor transporter ATP-binding protein EcfA2